MGRCFTGEAFVSTLITTAVTCCGAEGAVGCVAKLVIGLEDEPILFVAW